jgi:phage tail protein X
MNRYNTTKQLGGRARYFGTTKYPVVSYSTNDIYVITQEDDRFDQLAQKYYGDAGFWWIISCSNPGLKQNSYFIPIGIQIRIPQNIAEILREFQILNNR